MARFRDGDWELFDHDFETGRTTWYNFDGVNENFRVDYPVDSILKANEEHFADGGGTGGATASE